MVYALNSPKLIHDPGQGGNTKAKASLPWNFFFVYLANAAQKNLCGVEAVRLALVRAPRGWRDKSECCVGRGVSLLTVLRGGRW